MKDSANFKIDGILIESSANRILIDGKETKVRKKVTDVLLLLAHAYPNSVSRAEMIETLWEGNNYSGNKAVTDAIFEVRQAIGDQSKAPRFVETVPKVGYRLLKKPEPVDLVPKVLVKPWPFLALGAASLVIFLAAISFRSVLAKQKVIPPFQPYEVYEAYQSGHFNKATEMAKSILAFDNSDFDSARLHFMLGNAHLMQDEYVLAVDSFQLAKGFYNQIGHGKGYFNSTFGEASARMYLEEWSRAKDLFLVSMQLGKQHDPGAVRLAQRALCLLALRQKDLDEALMWSELVLTEETSENAQAERLVHGLIMAIHTGDVSHGFHALSSVDQNATAPKLCHFIRLTEIALALVEGQQPNPADHDFLQEMLEHPQRDYFESLAGLILDSAESRNKENRPSVSFFMQ